MTDGEGVHARLAAAAEVRQEQERLQRRLAEARERGGAVEVDDAWAAALREKEQWLATHDPDLGARVSEMALERGRLRAQDQENREAYDAGCRAGELLGRLPTSSVTPVRGRPGTPSRAAGCSPT